MSQAHTKPNAPTDGAEATNGERREQVLGVVLGLMVAGGDRFSMDDVARLAACSKASLYKWFHDRDGLLAATVRWQASKVILPELPKGALTRAILRDALVHFAESWLMVIGSPVSVALNRLSISHAHTARTRLGEILLTHGPNVVRARLIPVLERARHERLLDFQSPEEAFSTLFGLVIADTQLRLLLGDNGRPDATGAGKISERAARAIDRFLLLFTPPSK